MRRRALFAVVFVPRQRGVRASEVTQSRVAALSCPARQQAPFQVCQLNSVRAGQWYRARGQTAAIRTINGVRPVQRPIDALTGTLGLSPWLNPGSRNEIEIESGAQCVVEIHGRVFVAALTEEQPRNSRRLSVWVENTLANAANVEVRAAGQSRSLYVPPESYEVAEFALGEMPARLTVELTKFSEALEEGYEVRQTFFRDSSGKWNPLETP